MEILQKKYDMINPYSLENKTILVTGASSGIGRQTALRCSEMGGNVVITGRSEERLQSTFQNLVGDGHNKVTFDISEENNIADFVRDLPTFDGIVMCAAIFDTTVVRHLNSQKMHNIFNTNTFSSILLSQQLLKQKKVNFGASIVFISSVASTRPYKGNALYSATKGAINSFSKVMAVELGGQKIRVNCIHPGIVKTRPIINDGAVTEDQLKAEEERFPLGFGEPDDIAYASVYLLSNVSKWITGSDMIVDGGQCLV